MGLWRAALVIATAVAGISRIPCCRADPAGAELYRSKVQPLLEARCYSCHSHAAEKLKGGLVLDAPSGWLQGGDSGPAIAPGNPDGSLLIKAVRYKDENLQMPPKGKRLEPGDVALLEQWVKGGAQAPAPVAAKQVGGSKGGPTGAIQAAAAAHWAFQKVRQPRIPRVANSRWASTPVDAFVLRDLERSGMLRPSPEADRRTLLRRLNYDLLGLPPTPEEVDAFVSDPDPAAYARAVDRLLASPQFGERWGRYWLDVARYADTKGYVFEEERRYAYAYTYRDYVIRAFNEDLPYDRFVVQQLAADLLPVGEDKRSLAATGFLTLGRRFLNNAPDVIDDRIDLVGRGLMGLTVGCARCHDHKYDPIPSKDYYSLYGVFASMEEPAEKPLIGQAADPKARAEFEAEHQRRVAELETFRRDKTLEYAKDLRLRAGEYLLAAWEARTAGDPGKVETLARERKLDPGVVRRWVDGLTEFKKSNHPVFVPWFAIAEGDPAGFEQRASRFLASSRTLSPSSSSSSPSSSASVSGSPSAPLSDGTILEAIRGRAPTNVTDLAGIYGGVFRGVAAAWEDLIAGAGMAKPTATVAATATATPTAGTASASTAASVGERSTNAPTMLPDPRQETIRQVLYADASPASLPASEIPRLFDVPTGQRLRGLQRKIEELDATHPGAPPRAMAVHDSASPYQPRVFIRGNPSNPGPEVPRQFLAVLSGAGRQPFRQGSGRLEMAQAIASPENPLTARVMVNRVWLRLFGSGFVRTPSDFGLRSEPPHHAELLDYLASRFVEKGWSVKSLIREIVMSHTYRQCGELDADGWRVDAADNLLWRMPNRRLDFEAMRDTLLAVSGQLDTATVGGQAVDITVAPYPRRRTVYSFIERQNLPGVFRTFDFANPDSSSPQRFATTVPQQALFLMNSPFVVQQARALAARAQKEGGSTPEARVRYLFRRLYQRDPTRDESASACAFLEGSGGTSSSVSSSASVLEPWSYGVGEYDEQTQRIKGFTPLPHFTGEAWQGGAKLPDAKFGWAMVSAQGGHAGDTPRFATVRRWTAPAAMRVSFKGILDHPSDHGDGVRARVVSGRAGLLATGEAFHSRTEIAAKEIEVQPGETLDFVVDCRGDNNSDSFGWAPEIVELDTGPRVGGGDATRRVSKAESASLRSWNAADGFRGPPTDDDRMLSGGERLAQALLLSNELAFVD